jgi:phosphoenolpyruvate carboxykinase (diphosphate)
LTREQAQNLVDHIAEFDQYTEPMKRLIQSFVEQPTTDYVVSSAHPRLVQGIPSKNQRYLQRRPDLVHPEAYYVASVCARLDRSIPSASPVHIPVTEVMAGRRNSPADPKAGLPPLAVYNPIHYQELPELFMDFTCSLTGKSPSTTGFGTEGALTKGPFNALWPVVDLNNALVSAILTCYPGYTTAAGHIGPYYRVDHDISMLIPELWCRMRDTERDPLFLIENGFLEKLEDFELNGRKVLASRLGYRITALFAERFLGRIFETPGVVFTEEILRPEKQDIDSFAAGVNAIVESQRSVALHYFADGSVNAACPPLKALLHIMVHGAYDGMDINSANLRNMFTRESLLSSNWYAERLQVKQRRDIALWQRHLAALESFRASGGRAHPAQPLRVDSLLDIARDQLARVSTPAYLAELSGTIGADPFHLQMPQSSQPGAR